MWPCILNVIMVTKLSHAPSFIWMCLKCTYVKILVLGMPLLICGRTFKDLWYCGHGECYIKWYCWTVGPSFFSSFSDSGLRDFLLWPSNNATRDILAIGRINYGWKFQKLWAKLTLCLYKVIVSSIPL